MSDKENPKDWASHLSNESTLDKTGFIVVDYSRKNLSDSVGYDLKSKLGSILVSGQLPTYPSPNSTTVNW